MPKQNFGLTFFLFIIILIFFAKCVKTPRSLDINSVIDNAKEMLNIQVKTNRVYIQDMTKIDSTFNLQKFDINGIYQFMDSITETRKDF